MRTVVGRGEPAEDTVEQAEALDCDLIAMGTHGHGTLKRVVLGSFAEKVRHATDVPLLLVKAKWAGDEPADDRGGGVEPADDAPEAAAATASRAGGTADGGRRVSDAGDRTAACAASCCSTSTAR